jgi:hypothetical protein
MTNLLFDLFARPAIAMIAWGAFICMTGVGLPAFGYWAFFMLNIVVAGLFNSSGSTTIKKEIKKIYTFPLGGDAK